MTEIICVICGEKVIKEDMLKYIGQDKCPNCGALDSFILSHRY